MAKVPHATTLNVRDTCLCLAVQRAGRSLARVFDEAFRPLDLTNGQFSLLMALNRPDPPPLGAVAQVLAMDRTTLTAALKPLQRRALVTVSVDPDDKRSRRLRLTEKGGRLLAAALPTWKRKHRDIERLLKSADRLRAELALLSS